MIIAQRVLKIVSGQYSGLTVPVSVYLPLNTGDSWSCAYEIGWPDRIRKSEGVGVDAVQAINAALQKIGTELYTSSYHQMRSLTFQGPGKGYGFPVPKTLRNMLIGDDKNFDGE